MVSAFLSNYFNEVTDYSFTADMETELDNVSAGITEWKGLLKDYWTRFSKYCESASKLTYISCLAGNLVFKVSRFGAGYFIGCDQHPKCKYIARTLYGEDDEEVDPEHQKNNVQEPKLLGLNPGSNEKGNHPDDGQPVILKLAKVGFSIRHRRTIASVPKNMKPNEVTLEKALQLLQSNDVRRCGRPKRKVVVEEAVKAM
ncbi:DNA topoisomerase 1 [Sesamum angolense]|uniref:DNA topoisomerase 1 n=1 Tax=Sesamum angolense TaxID=2727404 RepID=A0AAE1W2K2_9LAMI|nr:DNA topoisomerase 1 [Sesamum angolense]